MSKAWQILLDGREEPSALVFEDSYEDAIKRAKSVIRMPYRSIDVRHEPRDDWRVQWNRVDKDLWRAVCRALPRVLNHQSLLNATISNAAVLGLLLDMHPLDTIEPRNGACPTPDEVRMKLRVMAGPYGRMLMEAKLKRLGWTILE